MKIRTFRGSTWLFGAAASMVVLALVYQILSTSAEAQAENSPATNNPVAVSPSGATDPIPATNVAPAPAAGASNQLAEAADIPPDNFVKPAQTQPVLPADVSPAVAEVAKLVQARVSDDVILAYIRKQTTLYRPTADEIIYLNDLGVSQQVLTELLQRGTMTWDENSAAQANSAPAPQPTVAANPPAPTYSVSTEQPAPTPAPAPAPVAAPPPPATVVAAPQPIQPVVTVQYFQDYLSPYGSWVWVDGYGWCWQPTVVVMNSGWRPYCDRGRWVYTDCGWYWESDYSWGWATFHYGRWWHHGGYGWVWMPDTHWGPSWVCWRHHEGYAGWAPLPPHARFEVGIGLTFNHGHVATDFGFGLHEDAFTFVAYGHFTDRHPEHFYVPRHEVATIYRNSTVINNYTVVNKTTIINEGVGRERVASITHQPIQPVSIRHVSAAGGEARMERVDSSSRTLNVYHPHIAPAVAAAGAATPAGNPARTVAAPATRTPFTVNHNGPQRTVAGSNFAGQAPRTEASVRTPTPPTSGGDPARTPVTIRPSQGSTHSTPSSPSVRVVAPERTATPASPNSGGTASRQPVSPQTMRPRSTTIEQPAHPAAPLPAARVTTVPPAEATRPTTVAPARAEVPATPARTEVPAVPARAEASRPAYTPAPSAPSPVRTTPTYASPSPSGASGGYQSRSTGTAQPGNPYYSAPHNPSAPGGGFNQGRFGNGNRQY